MAKRLASICDQQERDVFAYSSTSEDEDKEQEEEEETCAPDDESGTQWVFQGHLYLQTDNATLFDPAPLQSSSIYNFSAAFQEIYFKNRPVHIDCLQIFHDPDDFNRTYDKTRKCFVCRFLVRAYLQGKVAKRRQLENWLQDQEEVSWFKMNHITLHEDYCNDVSQFSEFKFLARFGKRTEIQIRSNAWYFKGCLDIDDASWIVMQEELEQVVPTILACFIAKSTIPYAEMLRQLQATFLTVHADIENLALQDSDHQVPIRGFLAGSQSKIARYREWLPSFSFQPICGGLRSDPRFRAAVEKMRSPDQTSKWIEVFTMGGLQRKIRARRESDQVYNISNAHNESAMRLQSSTRSETLHPAYVDLMYRARRIPVRVSRSLPQRRRPLQKLPPEAGGEISRWCACSPRNLLYNIARLRVRSTRTRALFRRTRRVFALRRTRALFALSRTSTCAPTSLSAGPGAPSARRRARRPLL